MTDITKRIKTPVENSSIEQLGLPENAFSPDVNIYDNKEALVITMDIPGVHKGDVNLEIEDNNVLTIKAKDSFTTPDARILYEEFETGDYFRSFTISEQFDRDKISGKLENGVLEVIIPRKEEVIPKRIQINA